MPDVSIFNLGGQDISVKDATARSNAQNANTAAAEAATTANKNERVMVKSATQIDNTLAASVSSGDFFVIANSSESGSAIRIVNAGYTIKTVAGSIPSTDNIILARGETAHFVATSSTILEAV